MTDLTLIPYLADGWLLLAAEVLLTPLWRREEREW